MSTAFKLSWTNPNGLTNQYQIPFGLAFQSQGGSGGGAVDSVNGKTGVVVLNADDLDAYTKSETNSLLATKANTSDLSAVATSGSYDDLDNKPTIPTIPTDVSAFTNDAGYLTQHQDISGKVDKEAGKGLSTNDYSNADKTKVSKIITDGLGDKYLSDDGNYKTVSGGGVLEADVKGWIARNIAVGSVYVGGVVQPSAAHSGSISIGDGAISYGNQSIQIGRGANSKAKSVSIGESAKCDEADAVVIGSASRASNYYAIAIGKDSQAQHSSVALGYRAINSNNTHFNCVLLGSNTVVTSANQVQLGSSATTTYAYGAVQDRSDIRDKTDIQDCTLGLDFINALRPVKYKWDYREDYARDLFPLLNREDYFLEQEYQTALNQIPVLNPDDFETEELYQAALSELPQVDRNDFYDDEAYQSALEQQQNDREEFFQNPVKDGSKTRSREHHGLIAQEFKQALDNLGADHAAYQDHSVNGGLDVKSIGYAELIPNLIKAIQEISAKVESLENGILIRQ